MIGRLALGGVAALIIGIASLAAFAPIDPVAWSPAPPAVTCADDSPKLTFRPFIEGLPGTPDGLAVDADGRLVGALDDGTILRIDPATRAMNVAGRAPGRRLTGVSVATDGAIYAADEHDGALIAFAPSQGQPSQGRPVVTAVNDRRLMWVNDVTAGSDGAIYFTTSSRRRSLDRFFDEVLEHRGSGQLLRYDPRSGDVREVRDDLDMANGVAFVRSAVFVAQSSAYDVIAIDPATGAMRAVVRGFPGFPGNLRMTPAGDAGWLTLLSPRSALVDRLAGAPIARRILAWAPPALRPGPQTSRCLIRVFADGRPPQAFRFTGPPGMPSLSTVIEWEGALYATPARITGSANGRLYVATAPGP